MKMMFVWILLSATVVYAESIKYPVQYQIVDVGASNFPVEKWEEVFAGSRNFVEAPPGKWLGSTPGGTIYGFIEDQELKPAVWSEAGGVRVLKNYRSNLVPEGKIILESLAMMDAGVVYGTYRVKYPDTSSIVGGTPKVYYNFAWQPATGAFKQLDVDGMRIIRVNNLHTLIGTLNGKPAICEGGQKPIEFSALLHPDQAKEWEIIFLSDINDHNVLVGVGKLRGNVHLFYAEPEVLVP